MFLSIVLPLMINMILKLSWRKRSFVYCGWMAVGAPHSEETLPNQGSPWQLHCPLGCTLPSNKHIKMHRLVHLNHKNSNVRAIGQGEAWHRKYKRLKLGDGQAYDRSSD
jgi:hypothetical protein